MKKIYAVTSYDEYEPLIYESYFISRENAMKYAQKKAKKIQDEESEKSTIKEYESSFCITTGLSSTWVNVIEIKIADGKEVSV